MTVKNNAPGAPKIRLSYLQVIALGDALKRAYDDATGQYRDGLSDDSVAEVVPFTCTVTMIKSLRREMFGDFKTSRTAEDRIADLERRLAKLESALGGRA